MTTDNPSPTPALTLSDKLMAMNHLTTFVPEKLDVDAMNYSSWVYYFYYLCHGYGILDHLVDLVASSSTSTPTDPPSKDAEWTKIDFIIRSWILSTLAPSLRKRLVDFNPTTSKDSWTYIAESIVSVLNGLGSPLSNDDVVPFALEGLPSTYEMISTVIVSREPFLDLETVRSLLTTHEMSLKSRVQNPLVDATPTSPMVLLAKSNTSARRGPSLEKVNNPCRSFAKGSCQFNDACKYLHNGVHGKSTLLPRTSGSASSVSDVTRSDLDMLQSLLAKFGLNAPNTSTPSPPVAYTVSIPLGVPSGVQTLSGPPQGVHLVPGPLQTLVQFTTGVQQQQGGSFPGSVYLGQSPSMPFHPSQLFASGSQGSGQATLFPNAFNTTTLQDPAFGNWNMDTGASSHLNDSVHCLNVILNMCIYPSVADFITRWVLLRCDSTGDLYPVTKPSTIPHAFLTSQYTWHQRLGHPGSKVLRRLVSSDSISCNEEKLPILYHACQLGKHVKLPFIEALNMAVYLLNILPFHAINNEIPFTRLFGAQPDYSVLRVFGCLCYPHIDTNHKLGPRDIPSIFLGHATNHFGYRFLDLNTNKIIISRHVTFDEMVFSFPSTKSTTTHSYDFLDDSTNLISTINRTAPITPVQAPVHTLQVDVPTPRTPPTPPPPPMPQSVPQIIPEHAPAPTNDSPTVSIHPMVTHSRVGTTRPNPRYAGHVSTISPLPRSYKQAFNDPNCLYKARLVANGSTQVEGVDVDETFIPVVKPGTIQTILSLAIFRHWFVHQLDVKNAFLHDLGALNYFLGISVTRDSSGMFISQRKYAMEILKRAHMVGCNPSRTPVDNESKLADGGTPVVDPTLYWSLAGSIQYLTFTRPDITYAVQQICLYMHDPREPHFSALKRILRYVQGTLDYGLQLFSSTTDSLIASSDSDWAGCPTTRRSTSGYYVFLGNNLLSWSSKRQPTLSRSSAEAEYRGVANAVGFGIYFVSFILLYLLPLLCIVIICYWAGSRFTCPSRFQYADIFTKGLPSALFAEFRDSLSVCCTPAPTADEY
uniref:Ribonuclease H-like domain-containing protein n=1 Tax=Tanacetum cinerariifolium TaxID=118510 RepID=A0A6L2J0P8_TANCI|nr:ribonuclease H-like domain-containing protein [Tanacetum cinerariifolium]